ncbi:hypothetical protein V1520DRAFT_125609 [Lipomyces starkeyi]|uniref:Uncharacterized protein n=1 Tax=Lipomyces starkeyi NRRL Y-11557 TaxID=675824 RepID=A0A1E3PZR1_LIPST|nr:hypothetical protein LIPSTDRAFT_163839 [Lipomyces starkeyi NRRL Y-11557]
MLGIHCTGPPSLGFHISSLFIIPYSLKPTQQQQLIPHGPLIDLLPFPTLRDNILCTLYLVDMEELYLDICSEGLVIWGRTPWDPASWEFSDGFAKKWWFLLDDESLRSTNFWRAQRGEEQLQVLSICNQT